MNLKSSRGDQPTQKETVWVRKRERISHGMPQQKKKTLVKLIKARSNLLSSGLLKNTEHVDLSL